MWALLSTRLRTWLFMALVVPVLAAAARSVARRLEKRKGPTGASRALHWVADRGHRRR
jgi:hypothetical protein